MEWISAIVQGILLGGLYALFAAGLSLIFGVMRLVNIAHGDLIIFAAYMALSTTMLLGVHPFVAVLIVVPLMAGLGYLLQRGLLNHTLGSDIFATTVGHVWSVRNYPKRPTRGVYRRSA